MICQEDGLTLIIIPYWWDTSSGSIARTLHDSRPDLHIPASLQGDVIPKQGPKRRSQGKEKTRLTVIRYIRSS